MELKKSKPKRKDIFLRFRKFWKRSKFDFEAKNKKIGQKKFKIMLFFIFLAIDAKNMKFKNDLALPTNQEIADYVKCHISWVKQVKQRYFGSGAKKLSEEEKNEYEKKLELTFNYNKIFGWKNLAIMQTESEFNWLEKNSWKSNSCFVQKTKTYKTWFTRNSKKKLKLKFFKYCSILFDQAFEKILISTKLKKTKRNFVELIFQQNKIWQSIGWFWKTIFWFRNNFEIFFKRKNKNKIGLIHSW